jgi:hypothetical protein
MHCSSRMLILAGAFHTDKGTSLSLGYIYFFADVGAPLEAGKVEQGSQQLCSCSSSSHPLKTLLPPACRASTSYVIHAACPIATLSHLHTQPCRP